MKWERIRPIVCYILAGALGVLLHFLYEWSPNVLFAAIAPVRESVWEHLKLLYWPMLIVGLIYTRKNKEMRSGWYLGLLVANAMLLIFGWVVNIRMGIISTPVDIAAYFILLLFGFLVAHWLPVGKKWGGILLFGVVILGALIVLLTFLQPDGLIFADLSLADALYLLPC